MGAEEITGLTPDSYHCMKTLESRLAEKLYQLQTAVMEQSNDIQSLKQRLTAAELTTTRQTDALSDLATTMTGAMTELTKSLTTLHDSQMKEIQAKITDLTSTMAQTPTKAQIKEKDTMVEFLLGLIDQYDKLAEGTNDCTISFGNEIAMLRIMMDACMDRVNWLSLPHLPLEGNAKDDTQDDDHQEKEVRRDGTSGGTSSTTDSHASPDVSEPSTALPIQRNEGRSDKAEGDEAIVVEDTTCSCCDRKSTKLVTCEPCGQQFHIDCMSLEQSSGTMLCRQCIADYTMIGTVGEGNTSTVGLLTQVEQENSQCSEASLSESSPSIDESEPSSFSQTTPTKRKTTSVHSSITKCTKKTAKSTVTAESNTNTNKTEQTLSQESTQTNKTTNDTDHGKKSIQSKLTKSSDTGTIQLTRPIRKTRQQTNSLPRKQTQL